MGNSPTRSVNYTPRMSDLEAYDLLPPKLRHLLQESPKEYGAYAVYRYNEKHGIRRTVNWIEDGIRNDTRASFVPARGIKGTKGYRPAWPSTVVAAKVKPLRANWEARIE